jgi:hypothetical protein
MVDVPETLGLLAEEPYERLLPRLLLFDAD